MEIPCNPQLGTHRATIQMSEKRFIGPDQRSIELYGYIVYRCTKCNAVLHWAKGCHNPPNSWPPEETINGGCDHWWKREA
jgi:hypothetical protein